MNFMGHGLRVRLRVLLSLALLPSLVEAAGVEKYVERLRRELRLSLPEGNVTASQAGQLLATQKFEPRIMMFIVPPRYVTTVSTALGHVNKCSQHLPRTLPREFVLASWVLTKKHMGRKDDLWRLWLESLPPIDPTPFWSDAELALLEDDALVRQSIDRRNEIDNEYDKMMRVRALLGSASPWSSLSFCCGGCCDGCCDCSSARARGGLGRHATGTDSHATHPPHRRLISCCCCCCC